MYALPANGKTKSNKYKPMNTRYQEVELYNNKVCTWKKDDSGNKEYKVVANYATIKEVVENKDTKDIKAVLSFFDGYETKEISVALSETTDRKKIMMLVDKGLDVDESNAKFLIKHLRNEREKVDKVYTHSNLGFRYYDDKLYFNHYKMLGATKEGDIESTYDGEILIKSKGSYKVWMDMVKSSVLGHTELELALVIGFSAAMVGYIGNDLDIESPLIHIYNDSSKGKTTAAMLAISPFGSPNQTEKGLFMTWNTTGNAMHESMGGNVGIPILFDESSMSNIKDMTSIIYSLTSGKNKIRMTKDCDIRNPKVWKTIIISTGENSLTSKTSEYTGIRARLFEFGNITWTKDSAHSEFIKETVIQNYGHYGSIFARILMKYDKEEVKTMYKEAAKRLAESMPDSQLKDRITGKFALITTTAEILKKKMKLNLNISAIEKMIVDNEIESVEDKDIADKALGILMEIIAQNQSKFGAAYDYSKVLSRAAKDRETWGTIEYKGSEKNHTMQIVMIASALEKALKENGFNEPKVVIKKWKENGILDCEKTKTYRKRNIGDVPNTKCHVIKIKEENIPKNTLNKSRIQEMCDSPDNICDIEDM